MLIGVSSCCVINSMNKDDYKYIELKHYDVERFSNKDWELYNQANSRIRYEMQDRNLFMLTNSVAEINISPELFDLYKKRAEDYNRIFGD